MNPYALVLRDVSHVCQLQPQGSSWKYPYVALEPCSGCVVRLHAVLDLPSTRVSCFEHRFAVSRGKATVLPSPLRIHSFFACTQMCQLQCGPCHPEGSCQGSGPCGEGAAFVSK